MYSFTFHIYVFLIITALMLPFFLLAHVFIAYEKIQAYLDELKRREQRFNNIDYLISIFKDENSSQELLDEALNAFEEHFLHFGSLAKDSKEYQSRLDFISAYSYCPKIEIDKVAKYREVLTGANANYKKEIETVIGGALKNREESKKDNKKKK
ncbi:MAG: hypothetical protein SOW25_05590 [Helicobacter sp.]|nr:hypothetical protein [Helicobacteraceae bacterium]MDY3113782.1 hypothetical protein [Helicobacter sp.]